MSTHSLISSILFYFTLSRFNKYNVMLNEKGKVRGKDSTCLPCSARFTILVDPSSVFRSARAASSMPSGRLC